MSKNAGLWVAVQFWTIEHLYYPSRVIAKARVFTGGPRDLL
jgi:hypothetical protein